MSNNVSSRKYAKNQSLVLLMLAVGVPNWDGPKTTLRYLGVQKNFQITNSTMSKNISPI